MAYTVVAFWHSRRIAVKQKLIIRAGLLQAAKGLQRTKKKLILL